jgi:hypothetical protein
MILSVLARGRGGHRGEIVGGGDRGKPAIS